MHVKSGFSKFCHPSNGHRNSTKMFEKLSNLIRPFPEKSGYFLRWAALHVIRQGKRYPRLHNLTHYLSVSYIYQSTKLPHYLILTDYIHSTPPNIPFLFENNCTLLIYWLGSVNVPWGNSSHAQDFVCFHSSAQKYMSECEAVKVSWNTGMSYLTMGVYVSDWPNLSLQQFKISKIQQPSFSIKNMGHR
jgi:hypothetical protein